MVPAGLAATLLLVRHAQSTMVAESRFQGRLDPPLSALGEQQAARLAAWLASPGGPPGLGLPEPPREIVHSPLLRVSRTADVIAAAVGRSFGFKGSRLLRPEPRLVEIGMGAWEGLTTSEVEERWGPVLAAWRGDAAGNVPPGGERVEDAAARVRSSIPALIQRLAGPLAMARRAPATVARPGARAAASSAASARPAWSIVVAHGGILRLLLFALLDLPIDRFWSFPFALASISVVDLRAGRAALHAHNLAEHLGGPPASAEDEAGSGLRSF